MINSNNNIYLSKYYLNICLSFNNDISNFKIVARKMRSYTLLASAINKLYDYFSTHFYPHSPGQGM